MKVQRIIPGVYASVMEGKAYSIALSANGFPGCGPKDYMAAKITNSGISPTVVGISLARARGMIGAWFPHSDGVEIETLKKNFADGK